MLRIVALVPLVAIALGPSSRAAGAELLSSHTYSPFGGGGWAPPEDEGARFWLVADELWPPGPALGPEPQPYWNDGDTGSFDFNATNTPGFEAFIAQCVDGQNGLLWRCAAIGNSHEFWNISEQMFFGTDADLAGSNIEFVRLVVSELNIWYDGTYQHADATISWEFWGSIPEPSTALLGCAILACGALSRRY